MSNKVVTKLDQQRFGEAKAYKKQERFIAALDNGVAMTPQRPAVINLSCFFICHKIRT